MTRKPSPRPRPIELAQARADGRLLDQAAGQIAGVRDPAAAKRLRDQLDALRRTLAGLVPGAAGTGPNGAPAPGVPTLAPSAGGSVPAGSGGSTGGTGGGGTGT